MLKGGFLSLNCAATPISGIWRLWKTPPNLDQNRKEEKRWILATWAAGSFWVATSGLLTYIYTQQLYSPQFHLLLKVVLVKNTITNKYQVLASSNPEQDSRQIVAYYQARFHLEFVFRDAKQFAGLEHAQTRKKDNLHNHFNLAMASINIMNILQLTLTNITSKNSLIRIAFNTNLIHQLIRKLDLKPELVNSKYQFDELYYYGAFAAWNC